MNHKFSKSLTDSDVRYKFFALNKLQAEPLGKLEENRNVKLECSDNTDYNTAYIDTNRRIRATDFFNDHNWLTAGTMVEFEINTDTNIIRISIDSENTENEETTIEKELTPALESEVRDFLANMIKKREFDNLELYQGIQGIEYNTKEVGVIDILCIDQNKDFVVIEIKKFKESDKVVGQIQRYMGWVKKNLATDKKVRGIIIIQNQEDDYESDKQVKYLRYAIAANPNISLKFYKMSISLLNDKISSDIK